MDKKGGKGVGPASPPSDTATPKKKATDTAKEGAAKGDGSVKGAIDKVKP